MENLASPFGQNFDWPIVTIGHDLRRGAFSFSKLATGQLMLMVLEVPK